MRSAREPSSNEIVGGEVRDAVSALQNLYSLLRSPRVGPKAIAPLLPEICESCRPAGAAVRALADRLAASVDDRAPLDSLVSYTTECIEALVAALTRAQKGDLDARARIALENEVVKWAPSIEAARGLFDLVEASTEESEVDVDVAELLEEALAPASQRAVSWSKAAMVAAYLPPRGETTISVRPRAAIPLLHLAIAHVHMSAGTGPNAPHLWTPKGAENSVEVATHGPSLNTPRLDSLLVKPPVLIPPSRAIAQLAARRSGVTLTLSDKTEANDGPHARVEFIKSAQ